MLTNGAIIILLGNLIHLIIWLFVCFFGLFYENAIYINIFIILPIIYISQSFKNHPIIKEKIMYICKNKSEFYELDLSKFDKNNYMKLKDLECLQKQINYSKEEIIEAMLIMEYYENKLIIPMIVSNMRAKFDDSFRNPFDAQGLIVLAYILNVYIFLIKNNKFIFKKFLV